MCLFLLLLVVVFCAHIRFCFEVVLFLSLASATWLRSSAVLCVVVAVSVESSLPGLRMLRFVVLFGWQGDGSLCRAPFHSEAAFKLFGLGPAPFLQAGARGKFPCRTLNLLGRMWTQCRGSMMRSVPSSVSLNVNVQKMESIGQAPLLWHQAQESHKGSHHVVDRRLRD